MTAIPARKKALINLLPSELVESPVEMELLQIVLDGGIPYYEGFPQTMKIPTGYQAIQLAVTRDGKTYYDPRRFLQWSALSAEHLPSESGWAEAAEEFAKTYYFAVVGEGVLTLWVLAKSTGLNSCCVEVECSKRTESGKSWKVEEFLTGMGGVAMGYEKNLGDGWACECVDRGDACWILTPPPLASWPRAKIMPLGD